MSEIKNRFDRNLERDDLYQLNKDRTSTFLASYPKVIGGEYSKGDYWNLSHIIRLHIEYDGLVVQDLLFINPNQIRNLSDTVYKAIVEPSDAVERKTNTQMCIIVLTFLRCLDAKLQGKDIGSKIKAYQNFGLKLGFDIFSDSKIAKLALTDLSEISDNYDSANPKWWDEKDRPMLLNLKEKCPALFEKSYWENPNFFNQAEFERMINVVAEVMLENQ